MNKIASRLNLAARLQLAQGKKYVYEYLMGQLATLQKIFSQEGYVLCTYYFPSEIACLFQIPVLYIERIVGLCVGFGLIGEEEAGADLERRVRLCSYQRAFLRLIDSHMLPLPSKMIAVRFPCSDAVGLCEELHARYGIPLMYVSPDTLEGDLTKAYHWLAASYPASVEIGEVVRACNEAAVLKCAVDNLRMRYPGIVPSEDCLKVFTVENDYGTAAAIRTLDAMRETILQRIPDYTPPPGKRALWMGLVPLYDNAILSRIEGNANIRFIYEEMWMFGGALISSNNFFHSLSEKVGKGLFFTMENRALGLSKAICDTKPDFLLNLLHSSCSFLPGTVRELEKRMYPLEIHSFSADVVLGRRGSHALEEQIVCKVKSL